MANEHFNYVHLEGQVCRIVSVGEDHAAYVENADYPMVAKHRWFYNEGYALTQFVGDDGRRHKISMHVLLLGKRPGLEIDHINQYGLDNRRVNLRFCTHAENMANRRSFRRNRGSSFKGVRWVSKRRRWAAEIQVNGQVTIAGLFRSEEEAARAYDDAAVALAGEFASTNFPRESDTEHRSRHEHRKAIRTARRWTPEAIEYLRANYGKSPLAELAAKLGRSVHALKAMAYELELEPHRRRHFPKT